MITPEWLTLFPSMDLPHGEAYCGFRAYAFLTSMMDEVSQLKAEVERLQHELARLSGGTRHEDKQDQFYCGCGAVTCPGCDWGIKGL